jgi:UDP-N-acetylglucosamine/UDP-N-acetylgalactosamine diphosphorylase
MQNDRFISIDVVKEKIASDLRCISSVTLSGEETSIAPGCILGEEGPVILENCRLGRNVRLKGGYFKDAVFLDHSSMDSGAHVRGGTLLEEHASAAHTVGFKQTILFPYVKTGSLINFCDGFVSGGTDQNNHSEIGSSYVHFNYTPNQDKATASLFGDVARGVFLKERPIFLGGQGGAVGPIRVAYGSVIAAGTILRKDIHVENQLVIETSIKPTERPYQTPRYTGLNRLISNNISYIGNLFALQAWYQNVRLKTVRDPFDEAVYKGAIQLIEQSLEERVKRLEGLHKRVACSHECVEQLGLNKDEFYDQQAFIERGNILCKKLMMPSLEAPDRLTCSFSPHKEYLETIQSLSDETRSAGSSWLNAIVKEIEDKLESLNE